MAVSLTEDAIRMIFNQELGREGQPKPLLQVTDVKLAMTNANKNPNQSSLVRYRMMLSDGVTSMQSLLASQNTHLVDSRQLQIGSVVRLNDFKSTLVKGLPIIVVLDLEVVLDKHDIIGKPVPLVQNPPSGSNAEPPTDLRSAHLNEPCGNPPTGETLQPPVGSYSHQPQSTYQQPPSAYQRSASSFQQPPSAYQPSAFSFQQPPSAYQQSASSYQQPQSMYQQPQRSYQQPQRAYQQPQRTYQQQAPVNMNRGPIAKNEAQPRTMPIAALNPYQNRWTLKARVTSKSELRHYNNARGDGKVFSFDLLDSDGGEIRVTCFNTVADQFYNVVESGKIYLISKGSLRPAQKNFNHLNNDHEIFLENTSIVQPCFGEDEFIPKQQFHFQTIYDIEGLKNNSIVDVIGVVWSVSPVSSIMRKNGTETQKRALQLKDKSGRSVELTMWGNFCNSEGHRLQSICDSGHYPVLAVKSGRVSEFNGKALGTISSTQLVIEPDIQEARSLREWFEREGKDAPTVSISRDVSSTSRADDRKTVSQIKDEKLGTLEKPDWITVRASIIFIKSDNFCYTACPIMMGDRQCNKKVTDNGDGKYRCDRCDQSVDECDFRYILQLQIQDHTGMTWVTAFQEPGEEIMGVSAKEMSQLRMEGEHEKFSEILRRALFTKYVFKLKVKEELFSDEQRVKSTVVKVDKMNFPSESRFLLGLLDKSAEETLGNAAKMEQRSIPGSGMSGIGAGSGSLGNAVKMEQGFMQQASTLGGSYSAGVATAHSGQYGSPYSGASRVPLNIPATSCTSCGGSGHSSMNCPSLMGGPTPASGGQYTSRSSYRSESGANGGGSDMCYKCHQTGHWARDCPGLGSVPPAYGRRVS